MLTLLPEDREWRCRCDVGWQFIPYVSSDDL